MQDSVNERFKIFLQEKRLSQTSISLVLGTTPQTVSAMASGKQSVTPIHAYKLRDLYGLNVDWLYTGEGSMDHKKIKEENISREMFNELKGTLAFYKALVSKFTGVEVPSEIANFNTGSLSSKQGLKVFEYVQTQLRFPEKAQLTLLVNDKKLSATA